MPSKKRSRGAPAKKRGTLEQGRWWRFDRYEVADGYLRPVAGSLRAVDPWAAYVGAKGKTEDPGPHGELLKVGRLVVSDFQRARGRVGALSNEAVAALVAWCNRYGLLGLLSQRSTVGAPAPVETLKEWGGIVGQAQHWRTPTGWRTTVSTTPRESGWVMMTKFDDLIPERLRIAEGWGRYFPTVAERDRAGYRYPLPNSPAFWEAYAEPLSEVVAALKDIVDLADALAWARSPSTAMFLPGGSDEERHFWVRRAQDVLNALISTTSRAIVAAPVGLSEVWVSTSLVGSVAGMIAHDLVSDGSVVGRCAVCNAIFFAERSHRRHCSTQCRNRQKYENRKQARAQVAAEATTKRTKKGAKR